MSIHDTLDRAEVSQHQSLLFRIDSLSKVADDAVLRGVSMPDRFRRLDDGFPFPVELQNRI